MEACPSPLRVNGCGNQAVWRYGVGTGWWICLLQSPASTVVALEETFCFRSVWDLHVLSIPFESLPGAVSDVAQMVGLGEGTRVGEVTGGAWKSANCFSGRSTCLP
jgi:hypothetical protein